MCVACKRRSAHQHLSRTTAPGSCRQLFADPCFLHCPTRRPLPAPAACPNPTDSYCNGACIPTGTCCASDPTKGSLQCPLYQTCTADGGSCTAAPYSVCGLANLTTWTVSSPCDANTPSNTSLGCWQPMHNSNDYLLGGTQLAADYFPGPWSAVVASPTTWKGKFDVKVSQSGQSRSPAHVALQVLQPRHA